MLTFSLNTQTLTNLALWVLLGALTGIVTGQVVLGRLPYLLGDLLVGIIGALLGGVVLASLLNLGPEMSVVLAVVGAVLLTVLLRIASHRRRPVRSTV